MTRLRHYDTLKSGKTNPIINDGPPAKKLTEVDFKTGKVDATIPDAVLPSGQTVEIKSRKYLSDSLQLRRQTEISAEAGQEAKVYTVGETKVSKTVDKRMNVEPLDEMIKRSNTSGGD